MRFKSLFVASFIALTLTSCSNTETQNQETGKTSKEGRAEYEFERLKDPATGKIPDYIRFRELQLSANLPKVFTKNSRESLQIFKPIGPRNVGGRTRAISFDIDNPNNVLAGGISGGMWRSTNLGSSWNRVTNMEDHAAVSCMTQDTRSGKSNIFYYGSGEATGGTSASQGYSAYYFGNGMYKSTDHGATWVHLQSTEVLPQKGGDFSYIFNVATDPTRTDSDIVYAAVPKGIQRSNDGGVSWKLVLGGFTADYTDVIVTSNGAHYATFSSDVTNAGFWRSDDGISWVKLSPSGLPSNLLRTIVAFAPNNPNSVYFYSVTENETPYFWKYSYVSGNGTGTGGTWANRTSNLPPAIGRTLETQGGYDMSIGVKPNDENMVFIGGTNLFRSSNGFNSTSGMRQIGGYDIDGYSDYNMYEDNQHADQQNIAFNPTDPNKMLASTDGGLHYTTNCTASKVIWESFNNGYQTTQFFGIGIDHLTKNEVVVSGYQDNGSWWTNMSDPNTDWKYSIGGDGAFCAVEEGATGTYYLSSQFGSIWRVKMQSNGTVYYRRRATPSGLDPNGYLFNHPFVLNPANNNQMYLPHGNDIWRNSNLAGIDNSQNNWTKIGTVTGTITAIEASLSSPGVVYVGTRNKRIYKIEDNGSSNATVTEISTGITNGGYASGISIDPLDADKIFVVYSNYNIISGWYTEDGGANWVNVEGNLKGVTDAGVPPQFYYIGNGPSFRWASIIPTTDGNAYLLGTSIGLFATNDLLADSVVWVQQAADVIGNVVIQQMDNRINDGFCVVGTHGAGAFKTYFENNYDITSVENVELSKVQIKLYPNPAVNNITIEFEMENSEETTIDVMNVNGQVIQSTTIFTQVGNNMQNLDVSNLSNGTYFLSVKNNSGNYIKQFVK